MARKQAPEQIAGSFSGIPHAVMDSTAFVDASHHARSLLFELMRQLNGRNNGHLQLSTKWLKGRGWYSVDMIQRAKAELIVRQLVIKTRLGGLNAGPDLWAVTWLAISDFSRLTEVSAMTYHPGAWHFLSPAVPIFNNAACKKQDERTVRRNSSVPPAGIVSVPPVPAGGTREVLSTPFTVPPGGNNVVTIATRRNGAAVRSGSVRRIVGKPRKPTIADQGNLTVNTL